MIIDGLNLFFRAYMMDPSLGPNGQPTGGIKGAFKMLQKLVRENNPDKIFFCWDGPKSSIRRRAINSNYKEGRKPVRLNRNFGDLTEEDEKLIESMTRAIEKVSKSDLDDEMEEFKDELKRMY